MQQAEGQTVLVLRRLWAVALRHLYLYRGSWPRLVETLFWPILSVLMMGFTSLYLIRQFSGATIIAHVFIAGVLMNEIMLRTSMGMMVMLLEEIWSRNLGHLFASPLRLIDFILGILQFTLAKSAVSILGAVFIAAYLFKFSLFNLGWPAIPYFFLLVMSGWWYGMLVVSLLLRFGVAAEWMAWMSTWLIVPLVAPYYPVEILPKPAQWVSWALPATYVFQSMKALVANEGLHPEYLFKAFYLNIIYFAGAFLVLRRAFAGARRRGGLLQVGE